MTTTKGTTMDEPTLTAEGAEATLPLGWAILELMGHRRLGGFVSEEEIAGKGFLRIGIPGDDGEEYAVQFYSPAAVYCVTPCTEEAARAVAAMSRPEPVKRWELPRPGGDEEGVF